MKATCSSALGQTFLTGLFIPDFQARFGLSLAEIGAGYGTVVVLASLFLPMILPPVWRMSGGTAGFASVVLFGAAISTQALTSEGNGAAVFFFALFGLRLMARHGATFLMELIAVRAEPANRDTHAALVALLYPATLICLPPVIAIARREHGYVWFWANVSIICTIAAVMAVFIAVIRRGRKTKVAPDAPMPRGLPGRRVWPLLRNADFMVLTWTYAIPLVADTVLILSLTTYAENGFPLAAYAVGQTVGILGLRTLRRWGLSLRAALFGHLLPLLVFFGEVSPAPNSLRAHRRRGLASGTTASWSHARSASACSGNFPTSPPLA